MIRRLRSGCALLVVLGLASVSLYGQTPVVPAKPKAAVPSAAPQRGTRKPPKTPTKTAPAAPTTVATTPSPRPAEDLRFKASYTTGERRTESVTYLKGTRQRFEFGDTILIKQPDEKRTIQISFAAGSYVVLPDGDSPAPMPAVEAAAKPPGVVVITTSMTDTGERKTLFGLEARRLKTVMDRQPQPGACDQTKQHVETDGWYVDVPKALTVPVPAAAPAASVGGCRDEIKTTQSGDVALLGFPVSYTMTTPDDEGQPNVVIMDVSELEITTLDAGLFDVPPGLTVANNMRELSKAVSDANEKKLASAVDAEKKPGVVRIGVPELTNKTAQETDTRALRQRLIAELAATKAEGVPMAAAPHGELLQQANARGLDYVLVADITEMKVGGSRFGGVAKAMSKVAGTGQEKPATEASVAWQLLQPDGKVRLSSTSKGKDGGGVSLKTTIGLARIAGTLYLSVMGGKMIMNTMSSLTAGNLSGMGMLGSPGLAEMQRAGMRGGMGGGMDPTAGAASFLMQQVLSSSSTDDQAVSFDGSLGEAIGGAAKALGEGLRKKKS